MIPSDLSRGIAPDFASGLIPGLPRVVAPRPRELSPVALTAFPASRSPYAEEFLGAASPDSSPLPWPSRSLKRSALPCSPLGANMSTLQDSLHGTGCWFAPPSQRDTPLRHTGSPQCNGSLLRGSLAITATGLAPVSCQGLSGHTSGWLDEAGLSLAYDGRFSRSSRSLCRPAAFLLTLRWGKLIKLTSTSSRISMTRAA
jgi:hypothetical protein